MCGKVTSDVEVFLGESRLISDDGKRPYSITTAVCSESLPCPPPLNIPFYLIPWPITHRRSVRASDLRHCLGENVDELVLPVRKGHVEVLLELVLHHLECQIRHIF